MIKKIPVTIITGFLGAGKTTLLNFILKQEHGLKIAVIENEVGEKNIDFEFVLHEKEKIYQMTNGCICCSVREDLVKTLNEILTFSDKFDSVIIETTGLADPSPVLHTFKQEKNLDEHFTIDSIICLVDAQHFLIQIDRSPEVRKQISSANIILINKVDLVSEIEIDNLTKIINAINPDSELIKSTYSHVPMEKVFLRGLFKTVEAVPRLISNTRRLFRKDSNENIHDQNVTSIFIEFEGDISPQYFNIWIDLLFFQCSEQIYRMKGILSFKDEVNRIYFQSIHDYFEITKGDLWSGHEKKLNQIVVIGSKLDTTLLKTGFKSCVR